jgi:phosphate transport system permease protein
MDALAPAAAARTAVLALAAPLRGGGRRALQNHGFLALCLLLTSLAVLILAVLLVSIWREGAGSLSWEFLSNWASRTPAKAGIKAPLWGSIWVCAVCAALALPIGVATALYLEEFAGRSRLTSFIKINIANLSGVPSIVYGLLGLTAFSRMLGIGDPNNPITLGSEESFFYLRIPIGPGVLAGGLTLMLVVLPIVIVSSQEALRAVPRSLRSGSLALGATELQTAWRITLPASLPMILTGCILAISRAIGEAAPILVLGVPLFIRQTPTNLMSDFTVLPLQIFNWAGRPQPEFHDIAAAAIIVLLAVLLSFNALAVAIRQRLQRGLS